MCLPPCRICCAGVIRAPHTIGRSQVLLRMHPQTVQAAILCNPGAPSTCPGPCCHLSFWVVGMTCYKNLVFFGLHLVPILQCASRPADRMPPPRRPAITRVMISTLVGVKFYCVGMQLQALPKEGRPGPPSGIHWNQRWPQKGSILRTYFRGLVQDSDRRGGHFPEPVLNHGRRILQNPGRCNAGLVELLRVLCA